MAKGFPSSVLLTQDSPGVCLPFLPSPTILSLSVPNAALFHCCAIPLHNRLRPRVFHERNAPRRRCRLPCDPAHLLWAACGYRWRAWSAEAPRFRSGFRSKGREEGRRPCSGISASSPESQSSDSVLVRRVESIHTLIFLARVSHSEGCVFTYPCFPLGVLRSYKGASQPYLQPHILFPRPIAIPT